VDLGGDGCLWEAEELMDVNARGDELDLDLDDGLEGGTAAERR
jgi:hypothetical protein